MDPVNLIFGIIILVFSVIAHELSHGYAADALGDPTARMAGRLTLNPLRHIDPVGSLLIPFLSFSLGGFVFGWAKPVPYNPYNLKKGKWGEAIVAGAGIFTNVLLAVFFGLLIRFFGAGFSPSFITLASIIVITNIVLALFNLIPVPPLDGSKLLFSILPLRLYAVQQNLERFSLILLVFVAFVLWQFIVPFIGILFTLITGLR